jgi:hypothetical protein
MGRRNRAQSTSPSWPTVLRTETVYRQATTHTKGMRQLPFGASQARIAKQIESLRSSHVTTERCSRIRCDDCTPDDSMSVDWSVALCHRSVCDPANLATDQVICRYQTSAALMTEDPNRLPLPHPAVFNQRADEFRRYDRRTLRLQCLRGADDHRR